MDGYTFTAAMVNHLAWPVTILIIVAVLLFRLPWLAKFIKAVKYKDLELTIQEDFLEARVAAEGIVVERHVSQVSGAPTEKIARLVEIDPSIAIIEIWRQLEQQIIKLIQHNGLMRFTNPVKFIEHLAKLGKLNDMDLVLFRKLRDIRNASVHAHEGNSLSKAEVFEFSNFVELLTGKLEAIRHEPGYLNIPEAPTPS